MRYLVVMALISGLLAGALQASFGIYDTDRWQEGGAFVVVTPLLLVVGALAGAGLRAAAGAARER